MYLDTRDLVEKRNELKQEVLDSFLEAFEQYADRTESFEDIRFDEEEIEDWKLLWSEKINQTTCIDELEEQIEDYSEGSFKFGVTLIEEKDFKDCCQEFCEEVGYVDANMPSWIEIDWGSTADNIRQNYAEVEYEGRTYLFK